MTTIAISEAGQHEGREATVRGWLYNKRSSGKILFRWCCRGGRRRRGGRRLRRRLRPRPRPGTGAGGDDRQQDDEACARAAEAIHHFNPT